mmetsp:Transcript_25567/g.37770  ORF Transcript_25567/g.37770 Transcript_25567/m.37770 type:complete len:91 (-) Transcript_25567:582-854(-)
MKKLSGLQRDVLSLYRIILRVTKGKDDPGCSFLTCLLKKETSTNYARNEFRRQALIVKRSDFKTIEYQLRKGHKQIKLLKLPGVKSFKGH